MYRGYIHTQGHQATQCLSVLFDEFQNSGTTGTVVVGTFVVTCDITTIGRR